jgi:hypothetical protein
VPETLHIGAYPRIFMLATRGQPIMKDLQINCIESHRAPSTCPIAIAEGRGFESHQPLSCQVKAKPLPRPSGSCETFTFAVCRSSQWW